MAGFCGSIIVFSWRTVVSRVAWLHMHSRVVSGAPVSVLMGLSNYVTRPCASYLNSYLHSARAFSAGTHCKSSIDSMPRLGTMLQLVLLHPKHHLGQLLDAKPSLIPKVDLRAMSIQTTLKTRTARIALALPLLKPLQNPVICKACHSRVT